MNTKHGGLYSKMKQKNFRLNPQVLNYLKTLKEATGISEQDIITLGIIKMYKEFNIEIKK